MPDLCGCIECRATTGHCITNCCSTFRAWRPYTGRLLRCAPYSPLNQSVMWAVHEGIRMPKNLTEAKDKLLSTEYPRWRNFLSCAILVLVVTGAVSAWWYVYYTTPDAECHKGFLYFSVIWLAVQWVVIGYL